MRRLKCNGRHFLLLLFILTVVISGLICLPSFAGQKYSLNRKKATIGVGTTIQLKINRAAPAIKWSSSNKKVATVNKYGKVTAKRNGKATIAAKIGKKKLTCRITVKSVPKISKKSVFLQLDHTITVKITGTKSKVRWSVSGNSVVGLKIVKIWPHKTSCKVKGLQIGTCKLIAKVDGKTLSCSIKVDTPDGAIVNDKYKILSKDQFRSCFTLVDVTPQNWNQYLELYEDTIYQKDGITGKPTGVSSIAECIKIKGGFVPYTNQIPVRFNVTYTEETVQSGYSGDISSNDSPKEKNEDFEANAVMSIVEPVSLVPYIKYTDPYDGTTITRHISQITCTSARGKFILEHIPPEYWNMEKGKHFLLVKTNPGELTAYVDDGSESTIDLDAGNLHQYHIDEALQDLDDRTKMILSENVYYKDWNLRPYLGEYY